jgi:hypothetical protein
MFRRHLPLNPEAFSPECRSCFLRRYVGRHYRLIIWIWKHLLVSFRLLAPVRAYGAHLHSVNQLAAISFGDHNVYQ